jgi:hypothetical protein
MLEFLIDRYYDPATDEFLSVDPMLSVTGQPYAFTSDDPINATDPLGDVWSTTPGGYNTFAPIYNQISETFATGQAAVVYTRQQTGGSSRQVPTSKGRRDVDVAVPARNGDRSPEGTFEAFGDNGQDSAIEVKTGRTSTRGFIREQVSKDQELQTIGFNIQWDFFPNANEKTAPTPGLLKLLQSAGIQAVVFQYSAGSSGNNSGCMPSPDVQACGPPTLFYGGGGNLYGL